MNTNKVNDTIINDSDIMDICKKMIASPHRYDIPHPLYQSQNIKFISEGTMFVRFKCLKEILTSLDESGEIDQVNWDYVMKNLMSNQDPTDFNIIPEKITSFEQVTEIYTQILNAMIMTSNPWRKEVCKDCGEEFTISSSEIAFYRQKNLCIPKRCQKCRDTRKANAEEV